MHFEQLMPDATWPCNKRPYCTQLSGFQLELKQLVDFAAAGAGVPARNANTAPVQVDQLPPYNCHQTMQQQQHVSKKSPAAIVGMLLMLLVLCSSLREPACTNRPPSL
jgi:hypothetical protein